MTNTSCSDINQLCYELHWKYLEEDMNEHKILLKKKFDSHIRKYLCTVPHNQKFLLDETYEVLKRSISQMEEFGTANPALGFEAINLYACNLFIKPWRKEYRVLRMYSGYYQHEVKAHLRDAKLLFMATGYKQSANDTLVFDGEICPDKVRNVSRDAMSAYVECKIIKEIYNELITLKFPITFADIYYFREKGIGDGRGIIEAIFSNRNKTYNKIQNPPENNYYGYMPISQPQPHSGYNVHHCMQPPIQQQQQQQQIPLPTQQQQHQMQLCNLHPQQQQQQLNTDYITNIPYPTYGIPHQMAPTIQLQQQQKQPLDYYNSVDHFYNPPHDCIRPQAHPTIINEPQIHSYDYVDGLNTLSYDTYNNKPGNRYPLHLPTGIPFNIDNPICNGGIHYRPTTFQQQNYNQQPQPHYGCNIPKTVTDFNIYDNHNNAQNLYNGEYDKSGRNLIDLEDENFFQTQQKYYKTNEYSEKLRDPIVTTTRYENISRENKNRNEQQQLHELPRTYYDCHYSAKQQQQQQQLPPIEIDENHINDHHTSRLNTHRKNGKILAEYDTEKSSSRNSDFDSYEETEHFKNNKLINKNHDGIGSAHKWTKIMNEAEKKNGYTDHNTDLLKGLDLDTPSWDKKTKIRISSGGGGGGGGGTSSIDSTKKKLDNNVGKIEQNSTTKPLTVQNNNDNNKKTIIQTKNDNIKPTGTTKINNHQNTGNNLIGGKPILPIRSATTKLTTSKSRKLKVDEKSKNHRSTDEHLIALKQWNCMHCTYINSEDTRICEMCCKSKDFTDSKTQKCA